MEQWVILVGMGMAVFFGVMLLALVLKAAVASSPAPVNSKFINPAEFIQESLSYEGSDLADAIRGYDTPELFKQDEQLRAQSSSSNSPDDLA
jgi:hypothetical protein